MTIWKISNNHQKNIIQRQQWIKNNVIAIRDQCLSSGIWTIENELKPDIDLNTNNMGYEIPNSNYNWQLESLGDAVWNKWVFGAGTTAEEKDRTKALWESSGDSGLANDGWTKESVTYYIYGQLKLINNTTGEQWFSVVG